MRLTFSVIFIIAITLAAPLFAQDEVDAITPGELIQERPTLICLGFEWRVSGDNNKNASVGVEYRKAGNDAWKPYVGLYRTGGGGAKRGYALGHKQVKNKQQPPKYQIPKAFCGSIMDLEPGTEYQVRMTMSDPDGVEGEAVRVVKQKTRPEPMPFEGGEVRHVYPEKYEGEKEENYYLSIMHAVNGHHPWCDCFQTVHPNPAPPGTIIKVHGGTYKASRGSYRQSIGSGSLWQHGTHVLVADGEPGKPIAIVAAGDGEVIFDADGADNLFNVMGADYLYFEGLTIKNTRVAFHGGFQGVIGCKGLTVKNCTFENIDYGILAQDGRSEDFYIADNRFIGGPIGPNEYGAYAVNLSGQGHVVCYNYTENFWDHINVFTNALADPALGQQARSIDFYNNDMRLAHDNFIETDGGMTNIRVLRNRIFHSPFSGWAWPLSLQPVYQGPAYFVRNIVYNTSGGQTTFKNLGSGLVAWHNTATATIGVGGPGVDMRNNAFLPIATLPDGVSEKKKPYTLSLGPIRDEHILDYNAYLRGDFGYKPYKFNVRRNESQPMETLAELGKAIGAEEHGIELKDYSVFEDVPVPGYVYDWRAKENPSMDDLIASDALDFTPSEDSPLIDAGVVIPGINDDYTGDAPDIGAIEKGQAIHFGPRTKE